MKELEHVKSYLALEQIRFEDELQVEYDIQAHGFLLPSLSLQPLVENAVRHGVSKKAGGGKVTIRTTETGDAFMVTVCDDGVGFDPDRIPQSRHMPVGIENVRNRLWNMCGGTLAVRGIPAQACQRHHVTQRRGRIMNIIAVDDEKLALRT